MKKTYGLAALLAVTIVCVGCQSTAAAKAESEYIGDFDPVELGTGTLLTEKIFGSELIPQECTFMLYPKTGEGAILFKNELNKNRLLLNKKNRTILIDAIMRYAEAFNNRTLDTARTKAGNDFGSTSARIEWGPFQYNGYALPKVSFGYVFKDKAPYFTINIPMTKSPERKGDLDISYNGTYLYFTQAQCESLVTSLSAENIQAVVDQHSIPAASYQADVYPVTE